MQFDKELQDVRTVAIAGHVRPDGDSVGACIGWRSRMKSSRFLPGLMRSDRREKKKTRTTCL